MAMTHNPANANGQASMDRKRIPMNVPIQKLEVPEIPGYRLYWFRAEPGRLAVIASRMENAPYVVLECLAAGLPFLAPDVGGIGELVAEADQPRLLYARNVPALAGALARALRDGAAPGRAAISPEATRKLWLDWHATLDPPPPAPAVIEKWVEASEANNYSVRAQDFGTAVAKRAVEIQRAGHYPTLDLTASRSLASQTASTISAVGTDNTINAIGVTLAIPIYAGGAVNSRVREAIANEDKAKADLENLKRTAAQNARQFYLAVTNGLAQVRAFEAALTSSKTSLDSNKLGYEVGVRINIDVLNAQSQLFQTKRDLAKARYDVLLGQLKLRQAAGLLKTEDLKAFDGLFGQ